jgi:hypothetical protein
VSAEKERKERETRRNALLIQNFLHFSDIDDFTSFEQSRQFKLIIFEQKNFPQVGAGKIDQNDNEGTEVEQEPSSQNYEGADEDSEMLSNCDSVMFSQKQMASEINSQIF